MTNEILEKIAKEYGTPSYVFDEDEVRERAQKICDILNDGEGGAVNICYSIKANPFLIPALTDVVDFFEVCSPGELEICKSLKVPGSMIIYSGVHKETADTAEAIKYHAGILTAESVRQYEIICEAADMLGQSVKVILRLNSKSQFGMSLEDSESILKDRDRHGNVTVAGLHYFAGTQRTKLKRQREELANIKEILGTLEDKYEMKLPWFEYGPGFAFPYFEGEDDSDTLAPAKELAGDIRELTDGHDVTVEMGRFIASSCGYYLTSIADMKRADDHNWCIVDGGINHVNYLGGMMGLKVPMITHIPCGDGNGDKYVNADGSFTVCGSLCTTADILVRDLDLKSPSIGDLLIFARIGAYSVTEGIYLFLGRDMPKIIMYNNGKTRLVRDTVNSWKLNTCNTSAEDK